MSDTLDRVLWATVRTAGLEEINEVPKPGSPHPSFKGVVYPRLTKGVLELLILPSPPSQQEIAGMQRHA